MALHIELAPNERIIVGDAAIRNGSRRTKLTIETRAKVLRERDIIFESEADTPCKRLYLTIEEAYFAADPTEAEDRFIVQANEVMGAVPSMGPYIARIYMKMSRGEGGFFRALKEAQALVAYEAELLRMDVGPVRTPVPAGEAVSAVRFG
jgi:flagellar protein FlbT